MLLMLVRARSQHRAMARMSLLLLLALIVCLFAVGAPAQTSSSNFVDSNFVGGSGG